MGASTQRGYERRWIVRNIVEWLCALLMLVGPLASMSLAQERQPAEIDFTIPAQPLDSALNAFAVTSGWQVSAVSTLTSGGDSPGAMGRYTPEQAIQAILAGRGRNYRIDGAQMVTIERASSASALPAAVESISDGSVAQPPAQKSEKPVKVPEF